MSQALLETLPTPPLSHFPRHHSPLRSYWIWVSFQSNFIKSPARAASLEYNCRKWGSLEPYYQLSKFMPQTQSGFSGRDKRAWLMASLGGREMKSESCFCWLCSLSVVCKQIPKNRARSKDSSKIYSSKLELNAVCAGNRVFYPHPGDSLQSCVLV